MLRGDICWVDLGETVGSEQGGLRPCVIVQNDIGNRCSPTTIMCPITKSMSRYNATHVSIDCLEHPSVILCEQIRNIDKRRLKGKICSLDKYLMDEVDKKILIALGIGGN